MLSRFRLVVVFTLFTIPFFAQKITTAEPTKVDTLELVEKKVTKAEIENWIKANHLDTNEHIFGASPLHIDYGDIYHNGYFYVGRSEMNMPERNGFETLSGIFSPALYYGYFNSLYQVKEYQRTVNYTNNSYPFPPVLTSLKAGLGDYDHHYARINLSKNELFSYPYLEYQGDFLVQNGYWTDITSTETSMKHRLSQSGKLVTWELEFANWKKDIAMNELLPVYWQSTNFTINHNLQQFYASFALPWFKLKLLQESESANTNLFYKEYNRNSTRLQFSAQQKIGFLQTEELYEHNWNKGFSCFCGFYNAEEYQDKLGFGFQINNPVKINLTADCLDWKRYRLFANADYSLKNFNLGATHEHKMGDDSSVLKVKDIFNADGELDLIDISVSQESSVYCSYNLFNIKPLVAVGTREIEQEAENSWLNIKKQQPFLRLAMDVNYSWKNWLITARPEWVISKYYPSLTENPEYRFHSVQQIKYILPYDNAVVVGCDIYGHSEYYVANALNPYLIESSTMLDAWAGINVGNLFELRTGFKNVLSSSLYGTYPVPVSVYIDVLWLYLN